MRRLVLILLIGLAGCMPMVTRQQLEGLKQQTGGGSESMGIWVNATTLWYTGTSGKYDYYELHRPSGSMLTTKVDRYRVRTENTGREFARTVDQSRWRKVAPAARGHTLFVPEEDLRHFREMGPVERILTTQPAMEFLVPATRPYDPNDLRL